MGGEKEMTIGKKDQLIKWGQKERRKRRKYGQKSEKRQ